MRNLSMLCFIVGHEQGSRTLRAAKKHGAPGGTIFLGKGTVKNWLLDLLDIHDVRKEIVLMLAEKGVGEQILEDTAKEIALHKPHHGIAFSIPLRSLINAHCGQTKEESAQEGNEWGETTMHQAIFTIVEKGRAEEVIEASVSAGARGGTVINARGAGSHETAVLFAMPVEPEKEIVLIIAEREQVEGITRAVNEKLRVDEPGNGVIFVVDVDKTMGLHQA